MTNSRAGTVKARRRAKLSPETGGGSSRCRTGGARACTRATCCCGSTTPSQRAQLRLAEDDRKTTPRASATRPASPPSARRASCERTRGLAAQGIVSDGPDRRRRERRPARAAAACRAGAGHRGERRRRAVEAGAGAARQTTLLRRPFDGIVADMFTEVGEWTSPSPPGLPIPPVLDLIDTRSIYVSAPMDEVDSARVKNGPAGPRHRRLATAASTSPARVVAVAPYVLDVESSRTARSRSRSSSTTRRSRGRCCPGPRPTSRSS